VAQSSSAKKVAKLASKGKGKKVRFSGGTVFPTVIAGVVVAMLLLVFYARQTRPGDGSGRPFAFGTSEIGDHWHQGFAIRVCDTWESKLQGAAEETEIDPATGQQVLTNRDFRDTGIHSHSDGVIHWHANSLRAGNRAKLGVFLDVYDVEVDDDSITIPASQGGGATYSEAETKCGTEDAQLRMRVWDNFSNQGAFQDYITNFRDIRMKDGMVIVLAMVPQNADIPFPAYACGLREIGASDGGDLTTTTVASATSVAPSSTVADAAVPGKDDFSCLAPSEVTTTSQSTTSTVAGTTTTVPADTTPTEPADTTTPSDSSPDTTG
jgi:hypothetical protein